MTSPAFEPRPVPPPVVHPSRPASRAAAPGGRPPVPPTTTGGGGGGGGSTPAGPDLSAFMDQILGSRRGRDLAASGSVCRALDAGIGRSESLNALLSGAYWTGVLHTRHFRDTVERFDAWAPDRTILVAHAGGTRFDLLVMSSAHRGAPVVLPLRVGAYEVSDAFRGAQESGRSTMALKVRRGYYGGGGMPELHRAVREIAAAATFGAVLMTTPSESQTCVPVPAQGICLPARKDHQATAGVVLSRAGETLVTTVRHVLPEKGDEILVGNRAGRVVARDELTDSCLIAVPGLPSCRTEGLAGIAPRILPAFVRGHFNRVRYGRMETVITGADMSIFEYQTEFASKFYTSPDTMPGDSGTALIDDGDHLVAFAVRRSSAGGRHPAYSTWVCAEQTTKRLEIEI
jgi:hypothetical protein